MLTNKLAITWALLIACLSVNITYVSVKLLKILRVKKANSKHSDITSQDIFANYIRVQLENNSKLQLGVEQ